MTLPASGPIDLYQIADEFGLAHTTTFPTGFYGKGGAPSSGPLSFSDFYGRSNFTLSAPRTSINASGLGTSDSVVVTSTIDTTFTFSGGSPPRTTNTQTDSKHATIGVNAPSTGSGSVIGVIRVTATNGDYLDITYSADWGVA